MNNQLITQRSFSSAANLRQPFNTLKELNEILWLLLYIEMKSVFSQSQITQHLLNIFSEKDPISWSNMSKLDFSNPTITPRIP